MSLIHREDLENRQVKLTIAVDAESWHKALADAYQENRAYLPVEGYAPGAAPREALEKAYAPDVLYQEAVRSEEALRQQEQFNASMMQQYAQMAMQQQQYNSDLALQYAKMAGSSNNGNQYIAADSDNGIYAAYQAALASGEDPYAWLSSKTNLSKFGIGDYDKDIVAEGYGSWETNNTMSEAEFNQLMTAARQYVAANQQGRLDNLLSANESRLSYGQYQALLNQLDKLG